MGRNGLLLAGASLYDVMPRDSTSTILSRGLGGEFNLMSSFTVFGVLLSMATLFVIIPMLGFMWVWIKFIILYNLCM
ncbi:hypothetical protein [Campylobacter hyointestinalis]|uniref:hypothetical protein n=1 Tax=Campylobacter hyointestinalis TaxID=198 RepID=UPI0015E24158|nr:hypothetical protein [Campylobacter hyointestinalis]